MQHHDHAFSASGHPGTAVHPFAWKTLAAMLIPTDGDRSASLGRMAIRREIKHIGTR